MGSARHVIAARLLSHLLIIASLAMFVAVRLYAAADPAPTPAPDPGTAPSAVSDAVGRLDGAFRVNEQGAATYRIAILAPAGTGGVTPQISLDYSSASGNGLVGQGWSIGGLSAIARCRQTLYQDNAARPIAWSQADRFCLDGQRLVLAPDETLDYGAVGARYRTEVDTYATITSVGGSAGHPDYFTVEGKDGVVRTYGAAGSGAAVDSEQEARDGTGAETGKVLTWALSKLVDSVGDTNRIDFAYDDEVSGHRIKEIDYGFGASASAGGKIVFVYTAREDDLKGYVAGHEFRTERRLGRIDVHGMSSDGTSAVVRSYLLLYGASSASAPLSRLASVQECSSAAATVCYPATTFTWTVPVAGYSGTLAVDQMSVFETEIPVISKPGDVDGDGRADLVWVQADIQHDGTMQPELRWARSDGATLVPQTSMSVPMPSRGEYAFSFHVLDYDNDGYADLLRPDKTLNSWVVHRSNGTALTNTYVNTGVPLSNAESAIVADLDADGLGDILYHKAGTPMAGTAEYGARLMQWVPDAGVGGFSPVETAIAFAGPPMEPTWIPEPGGIEFKTTRVMDFDGDGRADIAAVYVRQAEKQGVPDTFRGETHLIVYRQNGLGQFTRLFSRYLGDVNTVDPATVRIVPADVNADGLTDLLYTQGNTANWYYLRNTGSPDPAASFTQVQNLGDLPGDALVQTVDFNRDGFPDILQPPVLNTTGLLRVRLFNPKTGQFQNPANTNIGYVSESEDIYHFMDVNGDGHAESVRITTVNAWQNNDADGDLQIRHPSSSGATTAVNTIAVITDGLGASTEMQYGPLNSSAVHTARRDANNPWTLLPWTQSLGKDWPVIDVMPLTFVVTQAKSSAPTAGASPGLGNVDAAARSTVSYAYAGAKMQGGGRGFLGFDTILSVDAQSGLWTGTTYRQDFPFIGQPMTTEVSKPLAGFTEFRLLGRSSTWWSFQNWGAGHASAPFRLYRQSTTEESFDLASGAQLTTTITGILAQDAWGNVSDMQVTRCAPSDPWCLTPLSVVHTLNTFGSTAYDQEKGRLSQTVVTHQRPGHPDVVRTTQFSYYTSGLHRGLLATETLAPGASNQRVTAHEYDDFGNRVKTSVTGAVDAAQTAQTRYSRRVYDGRGRFPVKTYIKAGTPGLAAPPGGVSGELLTEEVLSHNALGQPTQIRTDEAVTTTIRYGALGREYERYSTTGAWERTFYTSGTSPQCPSGLTAFYTETVAGGGATARSCHDTLGRVVRSARKGFDGTWVYADTTFDSAGRVRHQSQPYYAGQPAYWSTHSYDELGRLTQLIDPRGGVTTTTYAELLTTVTDPAGQQRREERNPLGEVVRVRDHNALGNRTTGAYIDYAYDATGNLVTTQLRTDGTNLANGVASTITTTIGYDTWGRKTSLADPDKGSWSYQYNAFDELIVQQDATGQKSLLGYDALGRLLTREDRRGDNTLESATVWPYDKNPYFTTTLPGRALGVVQTHYAADGTTQAGSVLRVFNYDGFKRPVGTAHTLDGGPTWSETQTYDAVGRLFQRFDASGADRGVQYVYNANGYLQQTLESAKSGASNLAYSTITARNAYGSVTQEALGNGYVTTRSFEAERGLALAIRTADVANLSDTQDLTLVWDLVGNLTSRRDQGASRDTTESYTYDALNRLRITSLDGTQTDATTYDAFGNLKSKTGIGTYTYASARPHAVTATSTGSKTWGYDANGNMTGGDGRTIAYTTHDKPDLITKGTTSADFGYGPGREYYKRVDTVAGVATTTWFVGATEIVDRSDGTRDIRRSVEGVVEQVLHFTAGTLTGTDTRYLLRDHLGSITGFMNGAAIDQEQAFDAWGRRENVGWASYMTVGGSTWNAIMGLTERGFTGHQHVDRLDFIHMNGRTYDPRLGRFMQADVVVQAPHDTQSYNRYSYLSNNPLNGTDPSGYFSFKDGLKIAGAMVAAYYTGTWVYGGLETAFAASASGFAAGSAGAIGAGVVAGAAGGAVSGGILTGTGEGAAWGAFSGAVFGGIGGYFNGTGLEGGLAHIGSHAVAGGTISVLQGGSFGHGFLSAGITKWANVNDLIPGRGLGFSVTRIATAAIIGGTVSAVSGGKFANGAYTAGFAQAFNGESLLRKWTTKDFLKHYFTGGGKAIDLGSVGLGEDFENAPTVRSATSKFIDETMQGPVFNRTHNDVAHTNVTDIGEVDFTGFGALFSVGDGRLNMSATCARGSCSFTFETKDYFIDALDIYDRWQGNQDVPLISNPFPINYRWHEHRSYGQ